MVNIPISGSHFALVQVRNNLLAEERASTLARFPGDCYKKAGFRCHVHGRIGAMSMVESEPCPWGNALHSRICEVQVNRIPDGLQILG